jgi:hypothetical protein
MVHKAGWFKIHSIYMKKSLSYSLKNKRNFILVKMSGHACSAASLQYYIWSVRQVLRGIKYVKQLISKNKFHWNTVLYV